MAACSAAAAVAIGQALLLGDGIYDSVAMRWLTAGIALAWLGLFLRIPWPRAAWIVCTLGVVWQLYHAARDQPLSTDAAAPLMFYTVGLPVLGLLAVGAILAPRRWRRLFIPLLLTAHFIMGAILLRASPKPYIDVFEFTKASCIALSHGQNPYAMTFPNVYWSDPNLSRAVYAPGVVVNGRVQFGYQYMPLSLIVAWLGHAIGGDYRLANLLAVTAAGGFFACAGRGALSAAAAAILLLTPRGYYVVERGWSEPVVLCALAAVVFCAARKQSALPWAVGLLLVSKQHAILAAPAVVLLLPRPWQWKTTGLFLAKAIIAALAVTLPMVLWNVHAFWHSAAAELLNNPFRIGSLNFAAVWVRGGHGPPPGWMAVVLGVIAAVIALWRAPRTAAGFALAVALIYLGFFALAKQAFGNYYFLTIGSLCGAVATAQATEEDTGP
jgi:hypothetical protein